MALPVPRLDEALKKSSLKEKLLGGNFGAIGLLSEGVRDKAAISGSSPTPLKTSALDMGMQMVENQ